MDILGVALLLAQAAAASAPAAAPWAVTTHAGATSTATTSSAWSSDGKARLVVRCDVTAEKIVSIQFIPKPGFAPALPRPVSIKADEDGWLGTNWQFPGTGAFVSEDRVVTNLAVVIAHGQAIHVRAMTPDNVAVDATFVGPGEAPVRRVLSACGYDFGVVPPRSAVPVRPAAAMPTTTRPDPDDDQ